MSRLAGPTSTGARLVLAPEVQLLYKSHTVRVKDAQDFQLVVGSLEQSRCDWLRAALSLAEPRHAWLAEL